jgi:hypothetical protein
LGTATTVPGGSGRRSKYRLGIGYVCFELKPIRRESGEFIASVISVFLGRPLIAVMTWAGNQILAKPLHLYGCFLYLLSIFVALPR